MRVDHDSCLRVNNDGYVRVDDDAVCISYKTPRKDSNSQKKAGYLNPFKGQILI